jgi:hypothetical protein
MSDHPSTDITSEKLWSVSVTDLVGYFREALVAMVPIAEKVRMRWREPYDDWDGIATALFNSIVIQSIENDAEGQSILPMLQYNLMVRSYVDFSYIGTTDLPSHAFIRFETTEAPFDTCAFSHLDDAGAMLSQVLVRFEDARFKVVGRKAGAIVELNDLNVLL